MAPAIRIAQPADWPELMRIRLAVRENRLVSAVIGPEQYEREAMVEGRGWVSLDGTAVAGFAIGNARSGNIWALFVDPPFEGRGHGRVLHDTMVDWLFAQGLQRLELSTGIGTRAQRFYEAAGWRATGRCHGDEMGYELLRPRA